MPSKDIAQKMFDRLMNFAMDNPDIPSDVLEAIDYVANYCGDIAHGRTYTPPKADDQGSNAVNSGTVSDHGTTQASSSAPSEDKL